MRKRIIITLISVGLGVLVITLSLCLFFVDRQKEKSVQEELRARGDFAVKMMQSQTYTSLEEFVKQMHQIFNMRVSVFTEQDNMVIGDSDTISFEQLNTTKGKDERTECIEIMTLGAGHAYVVRNDSRAGGVTCNMALLVEAPFWADAPMGEKWIFRLQTPKQPVLQVVAEDPTLFVGMLVILAALCISGGWFFANRLMDPVAEIASAVDKINQGLPSEQYDNHILVYGGDEIAQLGIGLNTLMDYIKGMAVKLSQTNVEMSSMLNAMTNGLLAVDTNFRIILINKCAMQLLGIHMEPEEALGQHFMDISLNVRIEGYLKRSMAQESNELIQCETVLAPPDAERTIRMQISHLRYGTRVGGVVAMLDDVTQLRKLEKHRADFATNVSHEIKTPLTSIKGFIETLMQGNITDQAMSQKFLSIINLEADRLSRLIDDILNISRLESGAVELVKEPISMNEQIDSVLEVMRPHASSKNIHLVFEEQIKDAYVMGNSDNVHQLLINLVDNAIKYSPQDKDIHIMLSYMPPNVVVRVIDNGYGIENEHLGRLFERFYRVDKGRSRDKGGTGLGLAIVKHIVTSMNGHIHVASEVNVGTVFTLELIARDKEGNPLHQIEEYSA